jgi:hypothetical protein
MWSWSGQDRHILTVLSDGAMTVNINEDAKQTRDCLLYRWT